MLQHVFRYAPFCKHVFVPNFVDLPVQAVKISEANKAHVEHGYIRRTPKELPVLARFLPESKLEQVPVAKYLDIILYSREQIVAERVAQGDEVSSYPLHSIHFRSRIMAERAWQCPKYIYINVAFF